VTAATLQALAAELTTATLEVQSVTEQARLRGLTVETFGLTTAIENALTPAPFDFDAPLPPLNIRTVRPWDAEQTGTKP
jgi:hypothetical protein